MLKIATFHVSLILLLVSLQHHLFANTIAAGVGHSAVIDSEGQVWTFGENSFGALGLGETNSSITPTKINGLENARQVAVGMYHTVVLDNRGKVWVFGNNSRNQLGIPGVQTQKTPVMISIPANIIDIAAGAYHTLALDDEGHVWVWGYDQNVAFGKGNSLGLGNIPSSERPQKIEKVNNIISIAAGSDYSLALDNRGRVYAFGSNNSGQLGVGNLPNSQVPILVEGLKNIKIIQAGLAHSFAIDYEGNAWAFGSGIFGELGLGNHVQQNLPQKIESIYFESVELVATGSSHTLIVDQDGQVWGFGRNNAGQLGNGNTQDQLTPNLVFDRKAVSISAGSTHSLLLDDEGQLWGFGGSTYIGSNNLGIINRPTKVPGLPVLLLPSNKGKNIKSARSVSND